MAERRRYAQETTVAVERSVAEIEKTLSRYGATAFAYGWESDHAMLGFRLQGRQIRFLLPLPSSSDDAVRYTPTGRYRAEHVQREALEQEKRQRWRALLLVIKAKLEAVAAGIVSLEEEFLPWTVTPDGRTVYEHLKPQLADIYERGRLPRLLGLPPREEGHDGTP